MARPTKDIQDKLSKSLPSVRCTEADFKAIHSNAKNYGKSVSEYMRHMAVHGKVTIQKSKADFELLQELKRSGNNLNQLTKLYHSTGSAPIFELQEALELHHQVLKKVFTSL